MMKALFLGLCTALLLSACDPNANNRVGNRPDFSSTNNGSAGTGTGTASNNSTTDAPLDGGLSVLLVAGAAYGIKRTRSKKTKQEN